MRAYPSAITPAEAAELQSILQTLAAERASRPQFGCRLAGCGWRMHSLTSGRRLSKKPMQGQTKDHER